MKPCIEPECDAPAQRRQYCWRHYNLARGKANLREPKADCACGGKYYARNKCKKCYMVWFRSVDKEETFEPYALHPKHLNDLWVFISDELGVVGASERKKGI